MPLAKSPMTLGSLPAPNRIRMIASTTSQCVRLKLPIFALASRCCVSIALLPRAHQTLCLIFLTPGPAHVAAPGPRRHDPAWPDRLDRQFDVAGVRLVGSADRG